VNRLIVESEPRFNTINHSTIHIERFNGMKKILVTGGAGFIGSHLIDSCSPTGRRKSACSTIFPPAAANIWRSTKTIRA
jgi:hypothetical protein